MISKDEDIFLNMILEEVIGHGIEDLREMFWQMPKEELLLKYSINGLNNGLFKEFKDVIGNQFGKENEDTLTIELISRIYDTVKWLN